MKINKMIKTTVNTPALHTVIRNQRSLSMTLAYQGLATLA